MKIADKLYVVIKSIKDNWRDLNVIDTPKTVILQDIDDNGNLVDFPVQNLGTYKKKVDNWLETGEQANGAVNLYRNNRFMNLDSSGNHPADFSHFFSYGEPIYEIIVPDFLDSATGDAKIAGDLVSIFSANNWNQSSFNVLKVTCKGTSDTTQKPWVINQQVHKANGFLTRGCHLYIKKATNGTSVPYSIRDNPSGANVLNSTEKIEEPFKLMAQGYANGHRLGFNLMMDLKTIPSTETVTFYIAAPFFVEGRVEGYRTNPLDSK